MPDLLTRAQLNRALLARQHLLERRPGPAIEMVDHLVGLQAQNAWSPYVGLWSRVAGFRTDELGEAFWDRTVTRIAVMRSTIHLVTAADALLLPGLIAPLHAKDLLVNAQHSAALRTLDVAEVTAAARALVEAEPRVTTELGRLLARALAGRRPEHARLRGPRHAPPRPGAAAWRVGAVRRDDVDHGRGRGSAGADRRRPGPDRPGGARRRAGAVRPALPRARSARRPSRTCRTGRGSPGCGRWWTGCDLVRYRADPSPGAVREREVVDLPRAALPDPDVPAPVRFLPDYDNVLLGHADRTRIISPEHRPYLASPNGVVPATFLLDGRVAGTWDVPRDPKQRGPVDAHGAAVRATDRRPARRAPGGGGGAGRGSWPRRADERRVVVRRPGP